MERRSAAMSDRKRLPEEERKAEILDACDRLYEEKGFREITIKDISTETSFSRPSIYNYFQTKEEIFLGLLTREYELWTADLVRIAGTDGGMNREQMSKEQLTREIGKSLEKRRTLLKILAMNIYEIEENSRLELLTAFKVRFAESLETFGRLLRSALPELTDARAEAVRYAFFPFMNGIYPYAYPTAKQCEAMDAAGVTHRQMTIAEITENFLRQIL